jgi:O-antigen/teichoic acid export membrane protein
MNILKSKLLQRSVTFTFFSTINNGLNFLLIFLLSIYLTKEDFGLLNLFNVLIMVVTTLISLGTLPYFGIVFFKKAHGYLMQIYSAILAISLGVFVLFGVVVLALPTLLTNVLGFGLQYQLYVLVLCFLQLFYTINLETYRYKEKVIPYGILSLAWAAINFLLTVILCISLHRGWTGRADAQLISAVIFFAVNLFMLHRKGFLKFCRPQKAHYVEALKFGLPLIPHESGVWLRQGFDRYIINFFHGTTLVGAYSFAYNLSGILLMIGTAFNAVNSVYIFKKLANPTENPLPVLSKQIYLMTLLFGIIAVLGYFASRFVIVFLVPKYMDSIPYLLPFFMAAFFQCIYYLFVNYLFYYSKTKQLMYITFSISVLHFLLSLALTRFSVLYTAYITLFSTLLTCIIVAYYVNKTCHLFSRNEFIKLIPK